MPRKLAVRRIQRTEMTYFQPLFEQIKAEAVAAGGEGPKQKAVNLDKLVFVDQFYPMLKTMDDGKFEVQLNVSGPDDNRLQPLNRHVSKPKKKPVPAAATAISATVLTAAASCNAVTA